MYYFRSQPSSVTWRGHLKWIASEIDLFPLNKGCQTPSSRNTSHGIGKVGMHTFTCPLYQEELRCRIEFCKLHSTWPSYCTLTLPSFHYSIKQQVWLASACGSLDGDEDTTTATTSFSAANIACNLPACYEKMSFIAVRIEFR